MVCGDGYSSVTNLHLKILQIGDWNMDTTDSVAIPHGESLANILTICCAIVNDAGTVKYQAAGASGGTRDLDVTSIDATNVNLGRKIGGLFDSVDFDSTSYNRGFLFITHTV